MRLARVCSAINLMKVFHRPCRCFSGQTAHTAHCIAHRGLVRVRGNDASGFLQGLLTNSLDCLDTKCGISSLYTLLLNVQGRVLYDAVLYNIQPKKDYILEVDKQVVSECVANIKRYRLRKKVEIFDSSEEFDVFAVFNDQTPLDHGDISELTPKVNSPSEILVNSPDPRLKYLGKRLVTRKGTDIISLVDNVTLSEDVERYHQHRYKLGVGEGVIDHPPGNALPLECNAAFLNGVSFTKGCYIGQELTARTHHTGVIRKRLMPITLSSASEVLDPDSPVVTKGGKNCGKVRGTSGQYGLALLRISEVVNKQEIYVRSRDENIPIQTHVPHWWPVETDEIVKQALSKKPTKEGQS